MLTRKISFAIIGVFIGLWTKLLDLRTFYANKKETIAPLSQLVEKLRNTDGVEVAECSLLRF
ncbi:hypothetical protein, partial [Coleofasciculus sp. E2-BRE-01]|uniref:hypothetical protein n=1 Tax=Coleofasciculus sp. E2-BRE-01 TaxID=3069524 RepID=UPI0032FC2BBE